MTQDQPPRDLEDAAGLRMVVPDDDDETAGGDPVCWMHLLCDECGGVTSEGHRPGCSLA